MPESAPWIDPGSCEGVYILACRVLPLTPALEEIRPNCPGAVNFIEFEASGTPVSSGVEWSSAERLHSVERQIVEAFGLRVQRISDVAVLYIFIKLTKAGAAELLTERGLFGADGGLAGYNRWLNALLMKLAPEAYQAPLDTDEMPPHILYFEPSEKIAPDVKTFQTNEAIAQEATSAIGTKHSLLTPSVVGDMMLLPGGGYGQYASYCTGIRWKPFQHHETLTLPRVPLRILNHFAICGIKDGLSNSLRQLPVNGPEYYRMFSDLSNFPAYHKTYLKARGEAEAALLGASEARDLPELRTGQLYGDERYDFAKAFPWTSDSGDLYVQSMGEMIRSERRRADRMLEEALRHVTERLRILDGFLRDAALADASAANFKLADKSARLASSVTWLTWVILIFTVLSVLLSCIPQGVKEAPYNTIEELRQSYNGGHFLSKRQLDGRRADVPLSADRRHRQV